MYIGLGRQGSKRNHLVQTRRVRKGSPAGDNDSSGTHMHLKLRGGRYLSLQSKNLSLEEKVNPSGFFFSLPSSCYLDSDLGAVRVGK